MPSVIKTIAKEFTKRLWKSDNQSVYIPNLYGWGYFSVYF